MSFDAGNYAIPFQRLLFSLSTGRRFDDYLTRKSYECVLSGCFMTDVYSALGRVMLRRTTTFVLSRVISAVISSCHSLNRTVGCLGIRFLDFGSLRCTYVFV